MRAILFALSFMNIMQYVIDSRRAANVSRGHPAVAIFMCAIVSVVSVSILGEKYFWISSIFLCYLILTLYGKRGVDE